MFYLKDLEFYNVVYYIIEKELIIDFLELIELWVYLELFDN